MRVNKIILIGNFQLADFYLHRITDVHLIKTKTPYYVSFQDCIFWYLPDEVYYTGYTMNADAIVVFYDQLTIKCNIQNNTNVFLFVQSEQEEQATKISLVKKWIILNNFDFRSIINGTNQKIPLFSQFHSEDIEIQIKKKGCC